MTVARSRARIPALDIARSAALVAMVVFHFTFDLELFGHLAPGTTTLPGPWRALAVATAGSFLFLAGVSLWLAHGQGIRWRAFWRRFAIIAAAALAVSVGTYVAFPDAFVFFGILHSIALCSLFGLAALRLPPLLTLALAVVVFYAPDFARSAAFDAPWFWWTGLQTVPLRSVDYEPVFPWFTPVLAGIALAKWAEAAGLWSRLAVEGEPGRAARLMSWPGRHSLVIYLVHQPILIALVWSATQILR
jgi:uncharacterized membrane protein